MTLGLVFLVILSEKHLEKLSIEDEKRIVSQAKEDIEAFGHLYDLFVDEIFLYISYRIGNKEDAEDLTAAVFEKAMRNIEKFEWRGFRFKAWLYKIAHNIIIDTYKKKKITISVDDIAEFTIDEQQEAPDKEAQKSIETERLMKELSNLPDAQREIIFLRYIKELTIEEVMEVTNTSLDSVKSLGKRGLAKLRENMITIDN